MILSLSLLFYLCAVSLEVNIFTAIKIGHSFSRSLTSSVINYAVDVNSKSGYVCHPVALGDVSSLPVYTTGVTVAFFALKSMGTFYKSV